MNEPSPSPLSRAEEGRFTRRTELWISAWGGGTAWLLHLLLGYGVGEFGCLAGLGHRLAGGISMVAWMIAGATAISLAAGGWAIWLAWRCRNRWKPADGDPDDHPEYELARTALITNIVFLGIILVQTIPLFFFLSDC